jgi:hypothetical protein
MENLVFNKYQSSLEELNIENYPQEVQEQFFDFINNVPFIRDLISPSRPRAKDLPRDLEDKIIVDITKPHILEDMDYFRPTAIHYQKYGCFTKLRPNPNPNSEFGKWIREEIKRCYYGYVRESDGEWITGDMYFFLNYCPIQLTKKDPRNPKKTIRVVDFPKVWEGHYYVFHYLNKARNEGKHGAELASRGKGKSYLGAALLAKRFILGESEIVNKKVQCVVTASERKYIQGANQILDMFLYYINFCAQNTEFPSKRLTDSLQNMQWTMGYTDLDTGSRMGTENAVTGITSKDDESKLRGSRGVLYLLEEMGTFPRLLNLYSVLRPSVEDGNDVWGTIFAYGTAGDSDSDFAGAQELMYNPNGYNMLAVPNVYDKEGQGRKYFTMFFGGYLNRAECYNEDGVSNVTKAIIEILLDRYKVKYNSTDINAITKRIAEIPITPQEAILRTRGNIFPVTELNERLNEIDNNPTEYNDVYVGNLVMDRAGKVDFVPTTDKPIREFPTKDNHVMGAIEIFEMPQKVGDKIPNERYIMSLDNYENDYSETMSLGSMFVLDLWTDRIVAEYTGRPQFSDDLNEIARKMALFYNAKILYENNKRNTFAYFSKMNCLHLLADTPEYLKQRQLVKVQGYGNSAKGVGATVPIKNFGFDLIRDWLLKPVTRIVHQEGEDVEITVPNLKFIRNRALLKELILFNPDINVDRIMSLVQLMLYREEKLVLYGGNPQKARELPSTYLGNDDFFSKNYDNRFSTFK